MFPPTWSPDTRERSVRGKISTVRLVALAVVAVLFLGVVGGVIPLELNGSAFYADSEYPVVQSYENIQTNTVTFEIVAPGETPATLVFISNGTVINELSSVGAEDSYSYPPTPGVSGKITVYAEPESGERTELYVIGYGAYSETS